MADRSAAVRTAEECACILQLLRAGMLRTLADSKAELSDNAREATEAMIDAIGDAIFHLENKGQKETRPPLQ